MQSQKIVVISHWNVEGALQSPICITWLLNVPSTVANTILWTCSSMICICLYASDISSFERYGTLAISLWMISWSGNRVISLTVLSFCSHRLKTVCSLPFFFSMQSIGTAWCATAGIHHCAVVRYQSLMDLQQVCPTLSSSSAIPSVPKVHSYFRHVSDTPPFVPVPVVSPFVPMFPVSLISVSMSLWSSHLSHSFLPPVPVFPYFMLVPFIPSPWLSQANPAA